MPLESRYGNCLVGLNLDEAHLRAAHDAQHWLPLSETPP